MSTQERNETCKGYINSGARMAREGFRAVSVHTGAQQKGCGGLKREEFLQNELEKVPERTWLLQWVLKDKEQLLKGVWRGHPGLVRTAHT